MVRQDVRGNGVASCQLRGHVGQRVGGTTKIIVGRVGTQGHLELALQTRGVEATAMMRGGDVSLVKEMWTPQHVRDSVDVAGTCGSLDPLQAPTKGNDEI